MSQEQCQQAAYNKTLVPSADRVEISTKNMRIEPNVPQRKETFQKIKKSAAYEFGLDDKKFQVDVDVFREILGICLRVPKEDFVPPPSEEELLNFLLELGYKGPSSGLHTIKDDGVISRFKFVRIGEDFQEYGLAILETMLTEEIKHSEAYQTFIKYSTCLIPPKKSRGKGSQGKKTAVTPKHASVEVSDESDPEPAKIRTCSRRLTGVFIQDTSYIPKKKLVDHSQKLKGVQMMST
ncbi:hypothetical protein Tco_0704363 [Tanacetum coccineum]|uniref:Uncharacterized protein n=1 Tax=Tanacetum coccineum TaxID=301880 RepID=A0ABQ4Y2B1_9ASTR